MKLPFFHFLNPKKEVSYQTRSSPFFLVEKTVKNKNEKIGLRLSSRKTRKSSLPIQDPRQLKLTAANKTELIFRYEFLVNLTKLYFHFFMKMYFD